LRENVTLVDKISFYGGHEYKQDVWTTVG